MVSIFLEHIFNPSIQAQSFIMALICIVYCTDIALHLLKHYPDLSFTKDCYGNYTVRMLARKPSAFLSGSKLLFWERWIYSCKYFTVNHDLL